jgi:hypothetical protein
MGQLLGENEQLAMRNFQVARGSFRLRGARRYDLRLGAEHFNPNGNALLHFNLPNRNCSICAIEHTFNQAPLGIAGTISKLWHRREKISGNLKSQTGISLRQVEWSDVTLSRITRLRCATARRVWTCQDVTLNESQVT